MEGTTLDATHLTLLLAERKSGFTLHVSNPLDYEFLQAHRAVLEAAGCRVMRGCVQFGATFPADAVAGLLRTARARRDPDS